MLSRWLMLNIALAFIANLFQLKGTPSILEEKGPYTRIALTDSTTMEIYEADTITVVMTACAPQCSSCARVYNKEWKQIRTLTPPFRSVFPLATMNKETGMVEWKENDEWEY